MRRLFTFCLASIVLAFGTADVLAQEAMNEVQVLYAKVTKDQVATLSNLDPIPEDLGVKGAELGVSDNNTTGSFMGYRFVLRVIEGDFASISAKINSSDEDYVLLDMTAREMSEIVNAAPQKLYVNVSAYDNALRSKECHSSLLHSLPSYAMRTDALMQFLVFKRWDQIVMIEGAQPEDVAFAEAVRASAHKFGLKIQAEKKWVFDADMRRNASAEVPLFTQELGDYDAMIIADERNDFARYIAYNTWLARPIFGADGLKSIGWSRAFEQWGAAQLQGRFIELSGRDMRDVDYAAWAAIRSLDEAYVRTNQDDIATVKNYLLGEDFTLSGFKGRPLSFRNWNGQMRQPIGLASASALAAIAPLEGFLHATNELDSIGIDRTESQCASFAGAK